MESISADLSVGIATLVAVGVGGVLVLLAGRMEGSEVTSEMLRVVATYLIAVLVLLGAFLLIYQGRGDEPQAWLAIGAVLGYVFHDASNAAATTHAVRVAATKNGAPPA